MSFNLFKDLFGSLASIYWVVQMGILSILVAIVIGYIIMKFYLWKKRGTCTSKTDLTGKTVIITGANTGIGYETALALAQHNARVIVACRNVKKGMEAVENLKQESGNTNICFHILDMASFKSVKEFATKIQSTERRLDILVNNAGVTGLPYRLSENKLEYTFHTNYAGPFLLTNLLLDLMKKCAPSRIVNVTSIAHKWGSIVFSNLNSEHSFSTGKAYFNSKLELALFTHELARRLENTGVTANCLHPGTVNTQLLRYLPFLLRKIFHTVGFLFFKTATEGAQTTIHCAISEELEGVSGHYFSECKIANESAKALDSAVAQKLWEVTEKIVHLSEAKLEVEGNVEIHVVSLLSMSDMGGENEDRRSSRDENDIILHEVAAVNDEDKITSETTTL